MSVVFSKFPLEIIELIIDCLATQDDESFSSLNACSLVSRRLLPRTRSYIFSSIVVESRCHSGGARWEFERLFSQTPELAYYVTCLFLVLEEGDFANEENFNDGCDSEGFARALNSLTRLKSLSVSMDDASWKYLKIVKEPILNLMHLPTLSHLKLEGIINFELSDLTLCVGLKHLDIAYCGVEVGRAIEIYQEEPSRLESFKGTESRMLLQLCNARRTDGKPIVDTTGLKKLCLNIWNNPGKLKELFKHLTQLTSFEIHGCQALFSSTDFPDPFLPSLQTLQDIRLEIYINSAFPLVSRFASIPDKNVIENIQLLIRFAALTWDSNDAWSALDRVFTRSGWKKLRSFSLHIEVGGRYPREMEDVNNLMQELQKLPVTALKGLASNKNIVLDLEVSYFEIL